MTQELPNKMPSRWVEVVVAVFFLLLLFSGCLSDERIPFELMPLRCDKYSNFEVLCKSACQDILILEFGFCGELIRFTDYHYNLKELTISLGSVFDHNARVEERHWHSRRKAFTRRSEVKINYTLAIIDEEYTIQYLVFFNDVKPLAFDWKLHGHHDVIGHILMHLDLWHGIKQLPKPIHTPQQMWRVVLFEFTNRSDFPFQKPIPPLKLDYRADLASLGGTIIAVGYYCVTVDVEDINE